MLVLIIRVAYELCGALLSARWKASDYSSATIAWLKDQLGLLTDVAESAALADSIPNNEGVYLVPAFSGLSAPIGTQRAGRHHWDDRAQGAACCRAALESIAYQIRDVLEMMQEETGVRPRVVRADGGPTRNEFLMQFTADIAGVELEVAEVAESSAWGAAMAGLLGLGVVASLDELAALPRSTRRYRPACRQATRMSSIPAGKRPFNGYFELVSEVKCRQLCKVVEVSRSAVDGWLA